MESREPIRIIHVDERRWRLATIRDVAIILVCAALLLGTIADVMLEPRPPDPLPARTSSSVSM